MAENMPRSNTFVIVLATVATLLFGVTTWWVVDIAGGTKIESTYSNTPNATIPGPPGVK